MVSTRRASRRVGPSGCDPPDGASPAVHVQRNLDADDTDTLQARPHVLAERVQAVPPPVASPASNFNCIGNQPAHTLPAMSASKRRLSEIVRTPAGPPSSPSACAATGHPIIPVQHAFAAAPTGAPAPDKDMPPSAPPRQFASSSTVAAAWSATPGGTDRNRRLQPRRFLDTTRCSSTACPCGVPNMGVSTCDVHACATKFTAPTDALMVQLPRPSWYNSPCTEAVTHSGKQAGATCGLHAFNHLSANAASLVGLP